MTNKYFQAVEAYREAGSYAAAAAKLGIDPRTVKSRIEHFYKHPEYAEMVATADRVGINPNDVSHYWMKTKNEDGNDFSLFVKNNTGNVTLDEIREYLISSLKEYAPSYPKIEYEHIDHDNLLIIDPADVHIDKLAVAVETLDADYNVDIAVQRALEGIAGLVERAKPFEPSHIAFVIGNDILHTDNTKSTTTGGTHQDTAGMWWQAFQAAKDFYIKAIEYLTTIAPVTVVYCPSNHDYKSGYLLADTVFSWFRNNPNVNFGPDNSLISIAHRKYIVWGDNLIGFTHGDQGKEANLTNLMQFEARKAWGESRYAYWYVHHFHHKIRKFISNKTYSVERDRIGVTTISNEGANDSEAQIEYLRSPSPADGWHSRNGYINKAAIEAFIHHKTDGQIIRITHYYN